MAAAQHNIRNIAAMLLALCVMVFLTYALLIGKQTIFMPGKTTSGHYQIEEKCNVCHGEPFSGKAAIDKACKKCHGKELKAANDSHPASLFADPRNADQLAIIDARFCVTCHREHKPDITHAMGVTVPVNNCIACHKDIAQERPTHQGLSYATCDSAGCHNYHDNRALYEDFLLKHRDEPGTFPRARLAAESPASSSQTQAASAPLSIANDLSALQQQWQHSAHGQQHIACRECHGADNAGGSGWQAKPDHETCKRCHPKEVEGFLESKYGMRLAEKLTPMTAGAARQPTRAEVKNIALSCTICHQDHQFDIRRAAVEACLTCHNDKHSLAYTSSPHYRLWQAELAGTAPAGSGVSCATCHMPREAKEKGSDTRIYTQHNLNDNLRPNEKMIRDTCMQCHGLRFAIDALADARLVESNFDHPPGVHIKSMEMSETHIQSRRKSP